MTDHKPLTAAQIDAIEARRVQALRGADWVRDILEQDIPALLAEVRRLREALSTCAAQFEHYAKLHAEKGTPEGTAKGATNAAFATVARAALGEASNGTD